MPGVGWCILRELDMSVLSNPLRNIRIEFVLVFFAV